MGEALELNPSTDSSLNIGYTRTCDCTLSHLNCMDAKEWIKCQIGVWQFFYEKRDIRNKDIHPATFPISLSRRVIELFTHKGELVLDPFVGSGTTLVAAQDVKETQLALTYSKSMLTYVKKGYHKDNCLKAVHN